MRRRPFLYLLLAIVALALAAVAVYMDSQGKGNAPVPPPASSPSPVPESCGALSVYVLNVSQADSIFIITPGNKTILIDAGSKMKANSSSNVVAFLKKMNVSRIDYLIATHYHEDHIGGMDAIFSDFAVGSIYDNGNCANITTETAKKFRAYESMVATAAVKTPVDIPSDGCLSEAKLIFPYNQKNGCSKNNENDNSVLLHLAYGNTSFLFTGDCDENCEGAVMAQGVSLKSDFLKVGHHGSYTSSSIPFLDAVGAEYFVISADRTKSITDGYFHPREITLEKLYARSPDGTYRTDLNGNIEAVSDGNGISMVPDVPYDQCRAFMGYMSGNSSSYSLIPQLAGKCS